MMIEDNTLLQRLRDEVGYGKPDGFTTVAWKTSNEVYHTSNTPPLTPLFPSDFLPFREKKYRLGVPLQGA